jgi:hypothetical protein
MRTEDVGFDKVPISWGRQKFFGLQVGARMGNMRRNFREFPEKFGRMPAIVSPLADQASTAARDFKSCGARRRQSTGERRPRN